MVSKCFWEEPTSVISRERELEGPQLEVRNSLLETRQEVDARTLAKKAHLDRTMTPICIQLMRVSPRKVRVGVGNGGL